MGTRIVVLTSLIMIAQRLPKLGGGVHVTLRQTRDYYELTMTMTAAVFAAGVFPVSTLCCGQVR